jgi:thioredoxin-related protein
MKTLFANSFFGAMLAIMAAVVVTGSGSSVSAAELVMFKSPGCTYCVIWNSELGGVYSKTSEGKRAPLRRVDISDQKKTKGLKMPVRLTPTFVLMEKGKEVGRIQGYGGEGAFWMMLDELLAKLKTQKSHLALNVHTAK